MTLSFAVVCEDQPDLVTAATLADRVILDAVPWIEPETIDFYRVWRGYRASDSFVKWTGELKRLATDLGIVVTFKGQEPRHPYAQNALRAIRVLATSPDRVDAIVLIADSDGDADRLLGLEQARAYARSAVPVVIGLAHTKRECWHISGFDPETDADRAAWELVRQQLGFDPRLYAERLTASHDEANDTRSAKRVLAALTGGHHDRGHRCLQTPLPLLTERGSNNGLAAFLADVRTHLVPLFGGTPPEATG